MKILEIRNLVKKDLPLHYRNEFSCSVVYEAVSRKQEEKRVEFSVERDALGKVDIRVSIIDEIDYPLVPAMNSLKSYFLDLDKKGQLI